MDVSSDYESYAAKMRSLIAKGLDLEADARFVDMLVRRRARILDVGCGVGTAVNALRRRGHLAFGIDPSQPVLDVAVELYNSSWYHRIGAANISETTLTAGGLPLEYEGILMAGNVPAFLKPDELDAVFRSAAQLLSPGGYAVTGSSSRSRGGPGDQDLAAEAAGLTLFQRFCDWHLGAFDDDPWCVSVYVTSGRRAEVEGPDGIFVLPS